MNGMVCGGPGFFQPPFGEFPTWLVTIICTSKKLFSSKLPSLNFRIIRLNCVPLLPISPKMPNKNILKSLPSKNPSLFTVFIYVCLFLSFLLQKYPLFLCFVQLHPHPYLQSSPRGQIAGTLATIVLVKLREKRTDGWKWSQNDSSGTAGVGGHLPFPTLLLALATCFIKGVFLVFHDLRFFLMGGHHRVFFEALIVLL